VSARFLHRCFRCGGPACRSKHRPRRPFYPLPARSADFLLRWPRIASVWSAPGSSLVTTPPPSLGPVLISRCCFCELGVGPIQSSVNPWSPFGAVKVESSPFLARASAVTSAQASLIFLTLAQCSVFGPWPAIPNGFFLSAQCPDSSIGL
jgi:hypothetical protein